MKGVALLRALKSALLIKKRRMVHIQIYGYVPFFSYLYVINL